MTYFLLFRVKPLSQIQEQRPSSKQSVKFQTYPSINIFHILCTIILGFVFHPSTFLIPFPSLLEYLSHQLCSDFFCILVVLVITKCKSRNKFIYHSKKCGTAALISRRLALQCITQSPKPSARVLDCLWQFLKRKINQQPVTKVNQCRTPSSYGKGHALKGMPSNTVVQQLSP